MQAAADGLRAAPVMTVHAGHAGAVPKVTAHPVVPVMTVHAGAVPKVTAHP
ncbi:hypothetical protein IWX65_003066, partial [Arthrobacter sp. CAN_A214]